MAKRLKEIREEIVNSVGGGNIAGLEPQLPPGKPKAKLFKDILRRKKPQLSEEHQVQAHLDHFVRYASMELGLMDAPEVEMVDDREAARTNTSFGSYAPGSKQIKVNVSGRHVADVLRTLAHELVHHKQNEDGRLHNLAGETGSEFENEANSIAGVIMRNYGKKNPHIYESVITLYEKP